MRGRQTDDIVFDETSSSSAPECFRVHADRHVWKAAAIRLLAAVLLLALPTAATARFTAIDAAAQARAMQRGVNAIGFDPLWDDLAHRKFQPKHFAAIRAAGFHTIRVPMFAFKRMDAADRIAPAYLKSLDWVIDQALAHDLTIIIENHDMAACGKDVAACRPKLLAFWDQIATRYRDRPAALVFEPLNEPNGNLTDAVWNPMFAEILKTIRQTNPARNVVVGSTGWSNYSTVPALALPENDRHLIVTFHYYDPHRFTHQGAAWAGDVGRGHDIAWGSAADRAKVDEDFDLVAAWAKAHNRPILLGEFGAYEKAPMTSRLAYFDAVARAAEKRGWSWLYWQFDHDFIIYDMQSDSWVKPILKALIPESPAAR